MTKRIRRGSRQTTDAVVSASAGYARARAVAWLQKRGSPRLVMSMMLASTIGCGFLSSVAMHGLAVLPLWRYPLSVLVAWVVFLGLVSVWVWWQRRENETAPPRSARSARDSGRSWGDGLGGGSGGPVGSTGGSGSASGSSWGGSGGRFGGGGASESFADGPSEGGASEFVSSGGGAGGGGKGGGWGLELDGDGDFVVLLIGIAVVAAAVFGAAFYAVYSAPTFFAELLIDGGVGTWLYKRADVARRPDWLTTAIRRSLWPVVILLVMFVALALVMHAVAPVATTVGEAWRTVMAP